MSLSPGGQRGHTLQMILPWLIRAAVLAALGGALCLVPLFGVPGYEAALAL